MRLTFDTEITQRWAHDSLQLYRSKRYHEFKAKTQFPEFTRLPGEVQHQLCQQHNKLMLKIRDWLLELEKHHFLTVRCEDIELVLELLNYRIYYAQQADEVIPRQLDQLYAY